MTTADLAPSSPRGRMRALAFYAASVALHAALFLALLRVAPPVERRATPVEVEIVERPAPTPPPAPPATPEPAPAPEPAPRPTRPARVRPPPLPPDAPRPPPRAQEPEAPPPPSEAPARPGEKPAPIRFGVSMSSTTTAGSAPAPVGNTLYGRAPERAEDPKAAPPPPSERYAPPSLVSSLPEPLGCDVPRSEYPEEARRAGFEGEVLLRLRVDAEGRVLDAKVVRDPGRGLGAASIEAVRRHCRFRPALKDGVPVATDVPFRLSWVLD